MLGVLFCVAKDADRDRLIFDRRPENATMRRLNWAKLPSGACYLRMILKEGEVLRGSGDDLSNFYYHLMLPSEYLRFNGFGRRVSPEVVAKFGGDVTRPHRLCFRVLGMGDTSACDIAQGLHEDLVARFGGVSGRDFLRLDAPPPQSKTWVGVYLDDLLVTQKVRRADLVARARRPKPETGVSAGRTKVEYPDSGLVSRICDGYDAAGIPRALKKSFRDELQFRAWGAEIDGDVGRAAAPIKTRRDLWVILAKVLRLSLCSKACLQKILGSLCYCFQYRQECYSLMHHIYISSWIACQSVVGCACPVIYVMSYAAWRYIYLCVFAT
jgi:hypothetical protein